METLLTIAGAILAVIIFAAAGVIARAFFSLLFALCVFIRRKIGRLGTWISGLVFWAFIVLAILAPEDKPLTTNQQLAVILMVIFLTLFLVWLFSLVGAYIMGQADEQVSDKVKTMIENGKF